MQPTRPKQKPFYERLTKEVQNEDLRKKASASRFPEPTTVMGPPKPEPTTVTQPITPAKNSTGTKPENATVLPTVVPPKIGTKNTSPITAVSPTVASIKNDAENKLVYGPHKPKAAQSTSMDSFSAQAIANITPQNRVVLAASMKSIVTIPKILAEVSSTLSFAQQGQAPTKNDMPLTIPPEFQNTNRYVDCGMDAVFYLQDQGISTDGMSAQQALSELKTIDPQEYAFLTTSSDHDLQQKRYDRESDRKLKHLQEQLTLVNSGTLSLEELQQIDASTLESEERARAINMKSAGYVYKADYTIVDKANDLREALDQAIMDKQYGFEEPAAEAQNVAPPPIWTLSEEDWAAHLNSLGIGGRQKEHSAFTETMEKESAQYLDAAQKQDEHDSLVATIDYKISCLGSTYQEDLTEYYNFAYDFHHNYPDISNAPDSDLDAALVKQKLTELKTAIQERLNVAPFRDEPLTADSPPVEETPIWNKPEKEQDLYIRSLGWEEREKMLSEFTSDGMQGADSQALAADDAQMNFRARLEAAVADDAMRRTPPIDPQQAAYYNLLQTSVDDTNAMLAPLNENVRLTGKAIEDFKSEMLPDAKRLLDLVLKENSWRHLPLDMRIGFEARQKSNEELLANGPVPYPLFRASMLTREEEQEKAALISKLDAMGAELTILSDAHTQALQQMMQPYIEDFMNTIRDTPYTQEDADAAYRFYMGMANSDEKKAGIAATSMDDLVLSYRTEQEFKKKEEGLLSLFFDGMTGGAAGNANNNPGVGFWTSVDLTALRTAYKLDTTMGEAGTFLIRCGEWLASENRPLQERLSAKNRADRVVPYQQAMQLLDQFMGSYGTSGENIAYHLISNVAHDTILSYAAGSAGKAIFGAGTTATTLIATAPGNLASMEKDYQEGIRIGLQPDTSLGRSILRGVAREAFDFGFSKSVLGNISGTAPMYEMMDSLGKTTLRNLGPKALIWTANLALDGANGGFRNVVATTGGDFMDALFFHVGKQDGEKFLLSDEEWGAMSNEEKYNFIVSNTVDGKEILHTFAMGAMQQMTSDLLTMPIGSLSRFLADREIDGRHLRFIGTALAEDDPNNFDVNGEGAMQAVMDAKQVMDLETQNPDIQAQREHAAFQNAVNNETINLVAEAIGNGTLQPMVKAVEDAKSDYATKQAAAEAKQAFSEQTSEQLSSAYEQAQVAGWTEASVAQYTEILDLFGEAVIDTDKSNADLNLANNHRYDATQQLNEAMEGFRQEANEEVAQRLRQGNASGLDENVGGVTQVVGPPGLETTQNITDTQADFQKSDVLAFGKPQGKDNSVDSIADENSNAKWVEERASSDQYQKFLNTKSFEETVEKLKEIQYNNEGWLLDGYTNAVNQGDISPFIEFELYKKTAKRIDTEIVGLTLNDGTIITGYISHFIDRIIGQSASDDESRPGMRQGVSIESAKETLVNPDNTPERTSKETKSGTKNSTKYVGKTSVVTINPDTGTLIQTNPPR